MALDPDPTVYTEPTVTAIVDAIAAEAGDDFDADACEASVTPIVEAVEAMFRAMIADAEVTFASGTFTGADSNGDTPDTLEASGGTVS